MIQEQQFEKLFRDSAISYYKKEKNGKYSDVNQTFLEHYKKLSLNDIVGHKDIDLWNGKAPLFHLNDQKTILNEKSNVYIEDIVFENEKRFYLSCKNPLYSTMGKVIGIYGVSFWLNGNEPIDQKQIPEELIETIQSLQYGYFINENSNSQIVTCDLTHRQKECLYFFAKGMAIKRIAIALNLSPKTIENYLRIIKTKLNCFTRYQLIEKASELGLI